MGYPEEPIFPNLTEIFRGMLALPVYVFGLMVIIGDKILHRDQE